MDKVKEKAVLPKGVTTEKTVWEIANSVRNVMPVTSFTQLVPIVALAYWLKKASISDGLAGYIKENIPDKDTQARLMECLKRYSDKIREISEMATEQQLKDVLVNGSECEVFSRYGDTTMPHGLSKLIIGLLDIGSEDVVLNNCSGMGNFLLEVANSKCPGKALYGIDINANCVLAANIRAMLEGVQIHNILGDVIAKEYSELKATKVFSDAPFGMRSSIKQITDNPKLARYFEGSKRSIASEWVFALAAIINQKKSGKTVVMMTNSGLWNKTDEHIRQMIIKAGLVEAVISLPDRLLNTTALAPSLLICSANNKKVRMVDASSIYSDGRRQHILEDKDIKEILKIYNDVTPEKSVDVSLEELAAQEYILNPDRYIRIPLQADKLEHSISLGEIVKSGTINRGADIRKKELDELNSIEPTAYRYLMLKDIMDGKLSDSLPYLTSLDKKYDKFCVRKGNIVVSKTSPFKVAMVDIGDDKEKILANGNLYFFDVDETKANPIYVMLCLRSEDGMAQLNSWAKGVTIKSISLADLQKIIIPDIPVDEQNEIAARYEALQMQLQVVARQEEALRKEIDNLVGGCGD